LQEPPKASNFPLRALLGAGLFGAAGFFVGFFGPLTFSPSANQGPLLGIFITGPLGVILGAVFGLLSAAFSLSSTKFGVGLAFGAAAIAAVTLYLSFPEDRYRDFVIDAEIVGCESPDRFVQSAIERWDKWNKETEWREPRRGWRQDTPRMLRSDRGVVVTLRVYRRWEIYEKRKAWNVGELFARTRNPDPHERYFVRAETSCAEYRAPARQLYSPQWEAASVSPPDKLPAFLGLHVLEQVPETYRSLLR
jgi:hypothetical protein